MNTARAFGIALGILAEIAGVVLLVPPVDFLIQYWTDTDNPVRHEYMIGFVLAILAPTAALGVAAILGIVCRKALSRSSLLWMLVPGVVMALVTTGFFLIPMTIALFDRKI